MNLFNFDLENFQMTINNVPITLVGNYDSPWFSGKEICMVLGYLHPKKALLDNVKPKHKTTLDELKKLGT